MPTIISKEAIIKKLNLKMEYIEINATIKIRIHHTHQY